MSFRDHFLAGIIAVISTIIGGVAVTWMLAAPESRVSISADWLKLDTPTIVSPADIKRVFMAAGIPADEPISSMNDVAIVEITVSNPSAVAAKEVDLQIPDAIITYDPRAGRFARPKPGSIQLGRSMPNETKKLFVLVPAAYYVDSPVDRITATADGVSVQILRNKMMSLPMPLMDPLVQALNNSFFAQSTVLMCLGLAAILLFTLPISIYAQSNQRFRVRFMNNAKQRRTIVEDAEFIRQNFTPDYKELIEKKPAKPSEPV